MVPHMVNFPEYSEYIVYADESGDHSLTSIDKKFPMFSLSFCIIKIDDYVNMIVPAFRELKFKYWGHDVVILHEHEIRKSKGDFSWLEIDREKREAFHNDLNQIICDSPICLISCVIEKNKLKKKNLESSHPYEIALASCLKLLLEFLTKNKQKGKIVHVVFERRGDTEDEHLEQTFRRFIKEERKFDSVTLEPRFAKKSINSTGLQLADLTARPLALRTLRPDQPNRTYDIIEDKLWDYETLP